MGFDALLKRYFPAVICVLVAIAAYFQASGLGQLVASTVALDPSAVPTAAASPKRHTPAPASTDHVTSAKDILARNPFDSVTGPLDGSSQDFNIPRAVATNSEDWEQDPECSSSGKILLITAAEDRTWSFVAIAGADGKSQLRREGDEINGHNVVRIDWNRIWMMSGGQRCQLAMGSKTASAAKAPAKPAAEGEEAPKSSRRGKKVPADIAAKIHKVSDTEFNIERSVVDQILENQAEFMKSARIVPEKEDGKVVGIRLFGVRQDSLLGTLGLENGDRLQTINGFDMASPEKALEAYARLRTADRLTVTVNRKGKPMNIDFNIK
jgi:general secretion pathway protein C